MRVICLLVVALLTISSPVAAAERDDNMDKVAASGHQLVIGITAATEPDCSSAGEVVVRVLQAPAHGTFANRSIMEFPNFPASNPRSACNTKRVPATEQTYISKPGYTGPDEVDFEIIYPTGDATRVHVTINVM